MLCHFSPLFSDIDPQITYTVFQDVSYASTLFQLRVWLEAGLVFNRRSNMAINKLRAFHLKTKGKAKIGDGGGLWLFIDSKDNRRWVFRYKINSRSREMGLGSLDDVPMAKARQLATQCRELRAEGKDPITVRESERDAVLTFDECAQGYIEAHSACWVDRYTRNWVSTIKTYVSPVIGNLPVSTIETAHVMRILKPIWYEKTVTANHIRNRIERILSWAKASGYREGQNPAMWRDHLEHKLPKKKRIHKKKHFPAMPYQQVGEFMRELPDEVQCNALRLLILTASRTGAVVGARRSEVVGNTWTIPAERMKGRVEHRVPLSDQALALIEGDGEWLFPSIVQGKSIGRIAMWNRLNDFRDGVTVHGFRSSFRDWCAEQTAFPNRVAEYALAHSLDDETEASYQRSSLFDKRRLMMQAWADYCDMAEVSAEVVGIRG